MPGEQYWFTLTGRPYTNSTSSFIALILPPIAEVGKALIAVLFGLPSAARKTDWVQLCGYARGRLCMCMNQPKFAREVREQSAAMFVSVPRGDT